MHFDAVCFQYDCCAVVPALLHFTMRTHATELFSTSRVDGCETTFIINLDVRSLSVNIGSVW